MRVHQMFKKIKIEVYLSILGSVYWNNKLTKSYDGDWLFSNNDIDLTTLKVSLPFWLVNCALLGLMNHRSELKVQKEIIV